MPGPFRPGPNGHDRCLSRPFPKNRYHPDRQDHHHKRRRKPQRRRPQYDFYDHIPASPHEHKNYKPSNVSTNWIILDLGFSNYTDKTNYASASAQQFAPGATRDWFNLRTGKSINVNIWLFMQKLNLIKHVVNLKYGLGIELNNYRYTENIRFVKDPTGVIMDTIDYRKNKLAADYYTVPMMLDFNFTPHRKEGFGFSVGASAGYKYSSREKLISRQTGKYKIHDNFDMEPWKISWIGELHLGPVKLYGSLATKSMFRQGLDQTPYYRGDQAQQLVRTPLPPFQTKC